MVLCSLGISFLRNLKLDSIKDMCNINIRCHDTSQSLLIKPSTDYYMASLFTHYMEKHTMILCEK